MKNIDSEIFLIGSGRINRLKQPLTEVTNVTTTNDILNKNSNKISKIAKLNKYLGSSDCIIIGDQLNSKSLLAAKLAEKHDLPFLIRPRGTVVGEFEDRRRKLPFWRRYASVAKMRAVRNLVFKKSEGIIPVSYFVKNLIVTSNLASPADIEVAHVPYDDSLDEPSESFEFKKHLGMSRDEILITSVTGFSYRKKYSGILDYSTIIDSILKTNKSVHYAVVGGAKYPAGDQEEIEKSAMKEIDEQFSPENQPRLHFPGNIPNIENVYADTDVLLHLSYRDSLGTVVMEAGLFHLPVVVNTGGGMKEMLPNSGCSPNQVIQTSDELERKLGRLIESKKLRDHFGEENSLWIKNKFDKKSIGKELTAAIGTFTQ
jgi:glycosyltransferase involved in cell wall biosynthesis